MNRLAFLRPYTGLVPSGLDAHERPMSYFAMLRKAINLFDGEAEDFFLDSAIRTVPPYSIREGSKSHYHSIANFGVPIRQETSRVSWRSLLRRSTHAARRAIQRSLD